MTGKGHCRGALVFSLFPVVSVFETAGGSAALVAFLACVASASLPDWSEKLLRLPHRSIFHCLSAWLALAMYSFSLLETVPFCGAFGVGVSSGCIAHWLGDVPNKQGLPIFTPWDRFALHLWPSGKNEGITIVLILIAAITGLWCMGSELLAEVILVVMRLSW